MRTQSDAVAVLKGWKAHRNGDGHESDEDDVQVPADRAVDVRVVVAAHEDPFLDHVEDGDRVHLEGAQHVDEYCTQAAQQRLRLLISHAVLDNFYLTSG